MVIVSIKARQGRVEGLAYHNLLHELCYSLSLQWWQYHWRVSCVASAAQAANRLIGQPHCELAIGRQCCQFGVAKTSLSRWSNI